MSFSISLYTNTSEKVQVTKNLTLVSTLSGELRNESSIVDPIILVATKVDSLASCNYMVIPTFNRSYFITDIVSIRNDITEIHAHCDVLSSFWDYIKTNDAITHRQENSNNLYLDDGTFKVYQNPSIILKEFPAGFQAETYILAIAGPGSTS